MRETANLKPIVSTAGALPWQSAIDLGDAYLQQVARQGIDDADAVNKHRLLVGALAYQLIILSQQAVHTSALVMARDVLDAHDGYAPSVRLMMCMQFYRLSENDVHLVEAERIGRALFRREPSQETAANLAAVYMLWAGERDASRLRKAQLYADASLRLGSHDGEVTVGTLINAGIATNDRGRCWQRADWLVRARRHLDRAHLIIDANPGALESDEGRKLLIALARNSADRHELVGFPTRQAALDEFDTALRACIDADLALALEVGEAASIHAHSWGAHEALLRFNGRLISKIDDVIAGRPRSEVLTITRGARFAAYDSVRALLALDRTHDAWTLLESNRHRLWSSPDDQRPSATSGQLSHLGNDIALVPFDDAGAILARSDGLDGVRVIDAPSLAGEQMAPLLDRVHRFSRMLKRSKRDRVRTLAARALNQAVIDFGKWCGSAIATELLRVAGANRAVRVRPYSSAALAPLQGATLPDGAPSRWFIDLLDSIELVITHTRADYEYRGRRCVVVADQGLDVHREVQSLTGTFEECVLIDSPTSARRVLQRCAEADVVHFACHGLADLANPFKSCIRLPGNERLTVQDVLEAPLGDVQLVVLATCEGGAPGRQVLDESIGLPMAFLSAGARRVIASNWIVPDLATSELFAEFYEELSDAFEPAHCLAAAQRSMRDEAPGLPYRWSGFTTYC